MLVMNKQLGLAMVLALGLVGTGVASATPINPYVVKLTQQGNNVVAIGSGAFDLAGMDSSPNLVATPMLIPSNNGVATYIGVGGVAHSNNPVTDYYTYTASGQPNFGTGGETLPSFANGDFVVFDYVPSIGLSNLYLSPNYSSGDALFGSATWDNASFATLGVTPGTYTWTWGSAAGQSFTLDAVEAVPEPAELGMFGLGLLLIGGIIGLRGRGGRRSNKAVLS